MKYTQTYKKFLYLLAFLFVAMPSAHAFLPTPPVGPTPTTDPTATGATASGGATQKVLSGINSYQEKQSEVLGQLKNAKIKIPFKLDTSMFHKEKNEPNIPSVRKIEESTVADIKDEDSIISAFQTLFLTYPQDILAKYPLDQQGVKKAYKDKAVEFANDSMIEMYITVRSLEERMLTLKAEFDTLSACYVQGNSQNSSTCENASDTDEELGMWTNYYKLNTIYDSLLKITEELTAIKAQYEVAQAVRSSITPIEKPADAANADNQTGSGQSEEKVSFNEYRWKKSDRLAFAQVFSISKTATSKAAVHEQILSNQAVLTSKTDAIKPAEKSLSGLSPADIQTAEKSSAAAGQELPVFIPEQQSTSAALKKGNLPTVSHQQNTGSTSDEMTSLFGSSDEQEISLPGQEIVAAKPYKIESPYAGAANQFQALMQINNIYQQLINAKEIHNLKQQLPEYRNIFVEISKIRQLHEKAVERLKMSEQCVVNYLGNYYSSPERVWLGAGCHYSGTTIICNSGKTLTAENLQNLSSDSALCADDKTKICSRYGINNYASRGGFSGWLVSAYKTAKAEKVLDLNEDDFAVSLNDGQITNDISAFDEQKDAYIANADSGTLDSPWLRPSDQPEIEASNREQEILTWQIGAEGAKALGEDMKLSSPKWGAVEKAYPIWNDEKYFYDQYLAQKYQNMQLYIRDMDLQKATAGLSLELLKSIDDNFDFLNGITGASIKQYGQKVLNNTMGLIDKNAASEKIETALEKVQQQNEKALAEMRNTFNAKIVSLDNTKAGIYQNLDDANIELNESKQDFNTAMEEKQFAEVNTEAQNRSVALAQSRYAKSADVESNFQRDAEAEIVSAAQTIKEAEQTAESVLGQIDSQREAIDELNLKIEVADESAQRAKSDYAANASALEVQTANQLTEAINQMEQNRSSIPLASSSFLGNAIKAADDKEGLKKAIFLDVVKFADSLMQNARDQAAERVETAYQQIQSLGSRRYQPAAHSQIVDIHRQMIEDIKNPLKNADVSTLAYILLNQSNIAALVNETFSTIIQSSICTEVKCEQSDSQYFVGLMPKEKDFTAPKEIAVSYSAPLREIVHFDMVDFDNVVKSDNWMISRRALLDYGAEIPPLWKRLLEPKGFIERDVDISQILAHNKNAGDVLLRGGSYPCSVGKYDIAFKDSGYYVSPASGKRSACADVVSVNLFFTGKADIILASGEKISAGYGNAINNDDVSELSLLLSYNNGLTFSDKIKDIAEFYDQVEDLEDEDSYGTKGKTYEKALLSRNQFGDFLNFMEVESMYQKAIDYLEVKLDSTREKLKEQFAKFDYAAADDFDLADDKTYEEISQALDNGKNKIVNTAEAELQKVQPLNDLLEEKITKLNNVLSALKLDYDELILLSDRDAGDNVLSEKIKRKQTDNEVKARYDEEAQKEFEKHLSNFETPYCAVY